MTSGGYGHRVGKSLALALIDRAIATADLEVIVHIVGVERKARAIADSPYDPSGSRMRE